jgi:HmuY protein
MNSVKSIFSIVLLMACAFALSSCKDDPSPEPVVSLTFKDLNADYAPLVFGPGPPTRPTQKRKFTFFNFKTGQIVANADSATTKWDIGFRATSIILNGGTSGPGSAGAIVQKGIFDELKEAPESGYVLDNGASNAFAISSSPFVSGVTTTTNNWWFNSGTSTSTVIAPLAGQIILIRTNDNRYAKVEILSYYKGAPVTVNNLTDLDRHYTFRYVYQPNDTRSFE